MSDAIFTRTDTRLGEFAVRPVQPRLDSELLHSWLTHPKAAFWLMQNASRDDVEREFLDIAATPSREAYIGLRHGQPVFLVERYAPENDPIADSGLVLPGDVGMHFLVAPTDTPLPGFTQAVLVTVMELLFADEAIHRVVVEPDIRNTAVHTLNAAVGFQIEKTIQLPSKDALLSTCTRAQFRAAREAGRPQRHTKDTHQAIAHLSPEHWARANRLLIRKALAEFSHERLLAPQRRPDGAYTVTNDDGAVYTFTARRYSLNHWDIDAESITRHRDGRELPLETSDFLIELRETLGLSDEVLPLYLEEINSTLASSAFKLSKPAVSAASLAQGGFQQTETEMTEGHPCFVANNGRLGFNTEDYHAFAPEAATPVQLVWLAVHRDRSTFTSARDCDYQQLIESEIAPSTLAAFADRMTSLELDLDNYHLMPVHPWQWWNRLSTTFASEVAKRYVVYLGPSDDTYLAQQSIRTFFNIDQPSKHYVKTALSVLNMGFFRGLSAGYMKPTPAINDWLADVINNDDVLRDTGFSILRERAAIGYHHEQYEAVATTGSPYLKMLAALWRESPWPSLKPGERLATMASLLHVDRVGDSVVSALIQQSGLVPEAWLRQYLDAYLKPLLHCFYEHDIAFMPHGENLILVLADGVPQRVIMKDIAEEIVVMNADRPLPPEAERIRVVAPAELRPLAILTDVFDCFFRFLSGILSTDGVMDEHTFWSTVADCISDYQESVPHLAGSVSRYDLFSEEFPLSCLNRLQLRNNKQMVDLVDPVVSVQVAGTLRNPIAEFKRP